MSWRTLVIVAGIASSGCLVDRKTSEFACGPGATCSDSNRVCDVASGFCIPAVCPEDCATCDLQARTCQIACGGPSDCDATVTCPEGFACSINCIGNNACNTVACDDDSICDVTCAGINACDNVVCGLGADCDITGDDSSIGSVDCSDACRCALLCPLNACPTDSCPETDNGVECDDPSNNSGCDPNFDASCVRC